MTQLLKRSDPASSMGFSRWTHQNIIMPTTCKVKSVEDKLMVAAKQVVIYGESVS